MYPILLLALAGSIVALPRKINNQGLSSNTWGDGETEYGFYSNIKPALDHALLTQVFGPPPDAHKDHPLEDNSADSISDADVLARENEPLKELGSTDKVTDSECVPYYLCKNGFIVTDGTGIIDTRSDFKSQETVTCSNNADCQRLYEVCCKIPEINHVTEASTDTELVNNKDEITAPSPSTTLATKPTGGELDGNEEINDSKDEDKTDASSQLSATSTASQTCECVPYYLCQDGAIITDGVGLLDIRMNTNKIPNEQACVDLMHVCCNIPTTPSTNPTVNDDKEQPIDENADVSEETTDGSTESNASESSEESLVACISTEDSQYTHGEGLIDIRIRTEGNISNDTESAEQNATAEELSENCSLAMGPCCPQLTTSPPTISASYQSVCGRSNHATSRILGVGVDGEAEYLEFPWMAAILRWEEVSNGTDLTEVFFYQCGGSLIHRQVVLTAAHCIRSKNPTNLRVRLGEWDTQTVTEQLSHQNIRVSHIEVHEKFYSGALFNDVALLFLETEAEFGPNVDTICLPEHQQVFDHASGCLASGWGKDKFGREGLYQNILKKVELSIVPHEACQQQLRATRLGRWFRLHPSFTCAGGEEGKDTCKGDGGSPLVCPVSAGYYVQVGIVAWGIGCGEKGTPGVYVDVVKFVPWIQEKIKDILGIDISAHVTSTATSAVTATPTASVETSLVTPTTPVATTTGPWMASGGLADVQQAEDEMHWQLLGGDNQKKKQNQHKARKEHRHRWRSEKKVRREERKKTRREKKEKHKERRRERRKYRQGKWEGK